MYFVNFFVLSPVLLNVKVDMFFIKSLLSYCHFIRPKYRFWFKIKSNVNVLNNFINKKLYLSFWFTNANVHIVQLSLIESAVLVRRCLAGRLASFFGCSLYNIKEPARTISTCYFLMTIFFLPPWMISYACPSIFNSKI